MQLHQRLRSCMGDTCRSGQHRMAAHDRIQHRDIIHVSYNGRDRMPDAAGGSEEKDPRHKQPYLSVHRADDIGRYHRMLPQLLRSSDMGVGVLAEAFSVDTVADWLSAVLCDCVLCARQAYCQAVRVDSRRNIGLRCRADSDLCISWLDIKGVEHGYYFRGRACCPDRRDHHRLQPCCCGIQGLS